MNRNTRTIVVLAIAVLMATLASYGVYLAVRSMPVREVEVATAQTVVATHSLAVGTMVTKDDVKIVPWPAANIVPGSYTEIEQVVNRGTIAVIAENEPLTDSKLAAVGAGAGLPPRIPEGMRAVSTRVNEVIGVAGFVIPGTRVDVLVSIRAAQNVPAQTRVVLSNVEVLTAGTRYDQERASAEGKPIPTNVVTLILTPEDAEKLTLATEEGRIMLTLRNPLDTRPTETDGVRFADLLGEPSKPPVKQVVGNRVVYKPAPTPQPAEPQRYIVETIRAAKRGEEEVVR